MEENKQLKQLPFTIELAKKIQSGEVEGRIVTRSGYNVKILCFDFKHPFHPIVGIIVLPEEKQDVIYNFTKDGRNGFNAVIDEHPTDLFIELPEEPSEQLNGLAGCDGQCHSCTNDCTERKYDVWTHNFKVGDKVTKSGSEIIWTIKEIKNDKALIFADGTCGCSKVELRKLKHYKEKYEFKPFDKVLVRDNSEGKWVPDIFRYYDGNYPKDYPYRCCANDYKYCIPYEGNERLVGTTNNPE